MSRASAAGASGRGTLGAPFTAFTEKRDTAHSPNVMPSDARARQKYGVSSASATGTVHEVVVAPAATPVTVCNDGPVKPALSAISKA